MGPDGTTSRYLPRSCTRIFHKMNNSASQLCFPRSGRCLLSRSSKLRRGAASTRPQHRRSPEPAGTCSLARSSNSERLRRENEASWGFGRPRRRGAKEHRPERRAGRRGKAPVCKQRSPRRQRGSDSAGGGRGGGFPGAGIQSSAGGRLGSRWMGTFLRDSPLPGLLLVERRRRRADGRARRRVHRPRPRRRPHMRNRPRRRGGLLGWKQPLRTVGRAGGQVHRNHRRRSAYMRPPPRRRGGLLGKQRRRTDGRPDRRLYIGDRRRLAYMRPPPRRRGGLLGMECSRANERPGRRVHLRNCRQFSFMRPPP